MCVPIKYVYVHTYIYNIVKRTAIGAEAAQNIDNTRRKSGLFDQLTHHQGRQRSFFAAFQDTGAALCVFL